MGIGNENFYVIEEFISRGTLKEETFALSAKVYSAKLLIRRYHRKFISRKC